MRWMWIDRVVELVPRQKLVAIKHVSLAEDHLHDHFPASGARGAMPVMPASLIVEGCAQTAGILVGHAEEFREKVILAKIGKFEIERDAFPGQTLRYSATIQQMDKVGAATAGTIELLEYGVSGANAAAAMVGKFEMMFSHLDNNMSGEKFPEHNFVFGDSFKTLLRSSGVAGAW